MTGSRNTRLQAGQTRAGGSSTNLVGLAAISGRRAAQPRAREGSRGVGGRGSSLRRTIYPRQPTWQVNVRSSRVRVQHFILRSEKLKIWAPGYGPVRHSNTVNLDPPCSCAIALPRLHQGVVTYAPPVEAFATGIKIGSNNQRYFSDRSSDHSHFHERSRINKARSDVTMRQRTRTYARTHVHVARIVTYRGTGISEYARAAFHGANCTCTVATSLATISRPEVGGGGKVSRPSFATPPTSAGRVALHDRPN